MTQPPQLTITPYTLDDLPQLATLSEDTYRDTFASVNTPENMTAYCTKAFSLAQLSDELRDPEARFWKVQLAEPLTTPSATLPVGHCVGYLKCLLALDSNDTTIPPEIHAHKPLYIERFYIIGSAIGTGIAQQLMTFCETWAIQHGHGCLWLGVWEKNTRAIRFYEKHGFVPMGTHVFWLGDDPQTDLWLMKPLTPQAQGLIPPTKTTLTTA